MKSTSRTLLGLLFVTFGTWISVPSYAGLFRLESETLTSARNSEDLKFELPSYEFLSANYMSSLRDFEANADISVFADPVQSRKIGRAHV